MNKTIYFFVSTNDRRKQEDFLDTLIVLSSNYKDTLNSSKEKLRFSDVLDVKVVWTLTLSANPLISSVFPEGFVSSMAC